MKKLIVISMLLCLFLNAGAYSIVIYGRNSCGYTTALRNSLTANSIPFTYCNIDESVQCVDDMFAVVSKYKLGNGTSVNLPVVYIKVDNAEYGLERPSYNDVKALIAATFANFIPYDVKVYPIPTSQYLYIEGKNIRSIEILDTAGRSVMRSRQHEIDISDLVPSVYIVKVYYKASITFRIIKQ